ncbi:MAG: hypothetical protein JO022_09915, partial [Acidobacteriaceae bacterium]|nr:hypothetical protein [Acidobacteriaceae bacterium]
MNAPMGFAVIGSGLACAAGTSATELLDALLYKEDVRGTPAASPAVGEQAVADSTLAGLGPLRWRRYLGREAGLFLAAGVAAARGAGLQTPARPESIGI